MSKQSAFEKKLATYMDKNHLTSDGVMKILGRSLSSKSVLIGSDFHCGFVFCM